MKIKTFQALTMTEALRTIKEELGADAVILSTKSVKQQGKMFGLFGRAVVEVTAVKVAGLVKSEGQVEAAA
mgnify:CR=1 FL=1